MKSIEIKSQQGHDLVVEFTLNNAKVETHKISINPYYIDVEKFVQEMNDDGTPTVDKNGDAVMKRVITQEQCSPTTDVQAFLREWAEAYEEGLRQAAASPIDGNIINVKF